MKRLLLILTCLFVGFAAKAQDVPQSERDALVAFYDALGGDYWINKTNWKTSQPVSKWYGVTVSVINGAQHVEKLSFQSNGLYGELPPQIKNLTQLTSLSIRKELVTKVPDEIGSLTNLTFLDLTGPEPSSGLKTLFTIPGSIGDLTKLSYLNLNDNGLTALPATFANLKNLKTLSIAFNNFTEFPAVITKLTSLESFTTYSNNYHFQTVPDSLSNLVNLKFLYFSEWYNVLDTKILNNMPNLISLNLRSMDLGKAVDLSKLKQLTYINLKGCKNLEVVNLKNGNNSLFAGQGSMNTIYQEIGTDFPTYDRTVKCVTVDTPSRAIAHISPYQNMSVFFKDGFENNFQSDCSAFLNTNDIKISDLKIQNPVKDLLTIQTSDKIEKIELYSVTGQLVKTFKASGGNVSDLSKGVYILKAFTDKGATTHKIIKE